MEDFLAIPRATLTKIKAVIAQMGSQYSQLELQYVELPENPLGIGIAVTSGGAYYSVISILMSTQGQFNITSGILRDIQQDEVSALRLCNKMVRDNPAYPIFLHDAPIGWDILVETTLPTALLFDSPLVVANTTYGLPRIAEAARPAFLEANLGGRPFNWDSEDINRLLLVSLL